MLLTKFQVYRNVQFYLRTTCKLHPRVLLHLQRPLLEGLGAFTELAEEEAVARVSRGYGWLSGWTNQWMPLPSPRG